MSFIKKNRAVLGAALMGTGGLAHAALPTAATDATAAISADGALMVAEGWPILTAIIGGMILLKLFKKVVNRAT
jgi:hypothetical protein